jgi:iturin family lipopeptide synthetase A
MMSALPVAEEQAARSTPPLFQTMAEPLRWRARHEPDRLAYNFLVDGEEVEERVTYAELDARARAVEQLLLSYRARGERVLLLYPPGLDYIAALFGCLYAGAVAVPAYPPDSGRLTRSLPRLQAIVADSQAYMALTTTPMLTKMPAVLAAAPQLGALHWLATDGLAPVASDGEDFQPEAGALAFLQYTSGSTATPKGVRITHANVLANQAMIAEAFGSSPDDVGIGWLPFYHDMGLIGNVFHPMYAGYPAVLMSPISFLQRPVRWLRAISRYRGTASGGPNFAYDACVQRIGEEERASLDLSSWKTAFNGAEPIRAATLDRFAAAFAGSGFDRKAFLPCYGLAETTLIATCVSKGVEPVLRRPAADEPSGRRPVVGCGRPLGEERVLVVDPESAVPCEPGREGEIWVAGSNVAGGYWQRVEESERTFGAHLASGDGPFLRTGDLGVLEAGELFVTGRIKDVVIVRGRNIYPQDVELTVELAVAGVRAGCIAAFAASAGEGEGEGEGLGVAAELKAVQSEDELKALCGAIVAAVTAEHQAAPSVVALLPRGSIPKTSSGKLQRQAVRIAVDDGTIKAAHVWRAGAPANDAPQAVESAPKPAAKPASVHAPRDYQGAAGEAEVRAFLLDWLSRSLGLSPASIDRHVPLSNYGLASRDVVALSGALEEWLGRRISPVIAYEHPTVERLVTYLAAPDHQGGASTSTSGPATGHVAARADDEAIAIVGLGCRVPGAADPDALWRLLADGRDAIAEISPERLDLASSYDPTPARGRTYVKRAAMLDRVDTFDARFFGISTNEAISLDPQQRLLLEVAWEALEDAGVSPEALKGAAAGVFVGISTGDYSARLRRPGQLGQIDAYAGTGALASTAAGRISYLLGAHGPSLAVDTACSSSLVAVHLGCQSLRSGESDLVLAGGVSLILSPDSFVYLSQIQALAPDGRSKTFDAAADGYGRGEGCAIVVLKRLGDALAAGDTVLGVIRGSAVNHDGATNGLTAPSGAAQQAVIGAALARAGVLPHQVDYVEAHGTGTPLGDLIELEAIGGTMARNRATPLRIGSIKTNIGHLEAAAGVIGLVKTVLALQHGQIPPHAHLRRPNPGIDWEALQMEVPAQPVAWPRGSRPRLAGVSSFGLSGTNAHVIVGEPPQLPPADVRPARPVTILPWSAASSEALQEMGGRLSDWVAAHRETAPSETAAALAHVRAGRRHRTAVVGEGAEELAALLSRAAVSPVRQALPGRLPRVGFLFSGQGSQYPAMGAELDRYEAPFHLALDRCAAALDGKLARPLRDLLFDADAGALIRETRYTQPLMISLQYALTELWRAWGIEPVVAMGHSVGEISAACAAGILSIEDALVLATERGRLIDEHCPRGAMISAVAAEQRVRQAIDARSAGHAVSIAAVNAPDRVVFSGDEAHVLAIGAALAAEGLSVERLEVSHAFHSPHMEPAMVPLGEVAARIRHRPATTGFVSTATGKALEPSVMDPRHWLAQLREPVRFAEAARALDGFDLDALVEVGPQGTLLALHRRAVPDATLLRIASLDRGGAECRRMLGSLAALFERGADVRWDEIVGPRPRPLPRLPTYPFRRERFWLDEPASAEPAAANDVASPVPAPSRSAIIVNGIAPHVASPKDHRSMIAARLREIIGDLLRLAPDQVDEHMPLADMGVDSLIFIDGLQRVQQETGIRIPLREVWNGLDTVARLADYIANARPDAPGWAPPVAAGPAQAPIIVPAGRPTTAPADPGAVLTARQRSHIARLAERHGARTAGSKRRKAESHAVLADARAAAGYRVDLPAAQRQIWQAMKELAYPIVGQRSQGSHIWDVDGNEYVDFTMGFGVHLFGHGAPFLVEAVEEELRRGAQIGPQAGRAAEAAELIQELTGVERLTFCVTGSEAVMVALRLARARVGRPRVAAFAGSYHGSYDGVLPVIPLTHGVPAGVEHDMMVLEYGNPRSLDLIERRAAELSAVLVEPVQSRRPELQPREFLHRLREITARHGIALIFDEVLVGFRIAQGGAQAHFGVQADLVTYGKIVGGGLPVGVVAGRAEFLDAIDGGAWSYGNASAPTVEGIWHAGTFNKNPLAMAASVAALRRLRDEGPGLQERLNERTAGLVRRLREEFLRAGAPIEPVHFGSLMRLQMPRSLDLLYTHLIDQGVYVWEGRSMFLSTEHSDEDLTRLVEATRGALAELKKGGFLADRANGRGRPGARKGVPVSRDGVWRVREAERPLLFCFPYAGGSAATFAPWSSRLAQMAEVVPVSLPGRDARSAEAPVTDYEMLVEFLADQVAERLAGEARPFAFFGHSMGALLAFGVARKLASRDLRPGVLLVSGEPAPHLSKTAVERPIHLLDDAELLEAMARHGVPIDLRTSGLEAEDLLVLRADLALCQNFRLAEADPLDCRIVAFAGSSDPLAVEGDVAAWVRHTNEGFALHVLPGGHFFIREQRETLLGLVAAELAGGIWPTDDAPIFARRGAKLPDEELRP